MEKFYSEQKNQNSDHLPQSEKEWLETGKFDIEIVDIGKHQIRCAFTRGAEKGLLVTMIGGIPCDADRCKKLPLINKLYGHLAIKNLDKNISSLLYNQPATGGSSGERETETLQSRTNILAELVQHFGAKIDCVENVLIGASAGAYMAVNAIEKIRNEKFKPSKLILLSPAAYPEEIENVPSGEKFSKIIRQPWDIAKSPIFSKLEDFAQNGGSVYVSFFESDNPPIPEHIQEYFKKLVEQLSNNGYNAIFKIIPGVAHNFRIIGSHEGKNIVDNNSIRTTANSLIEFLAK